MVDIEKSILATAVWPAGTRQLYTILELDEEEFNIPANQLIFRAIKETAINGHAELIQIKSYLQGRGLFDKAGGDLMLLELSQGHFTTQVHHLISHLRDFNKRNKLKLLGIEISKGQLSEDEIFDKFNSIYLSYSQKDFIKDINYLSEIELEKLYGVNIMQTSGFHTFDKCNGGFAGGELIIIGARPSVGKSACALNIAKHINNAAFVSLEMNAEQILCRLLANISKVDSRKIRQNKYDNQQEKEHVLNIYRNELKKYKMSFFDKEFNINKIITAIYKANQTQKFNVVIIDYLQLIDGGVGKSRNDEIGDITRRLKLLAVDLNIPVILLSQLNRESTKQTKPSLISLRDSGNIEQDANVVFLIHYDEDSFQTNLIVAKNREGESHFTIPIAFNKSFMIFKEQQSSEVF